VADNGEEEEESRIGCALSPLLLLLFSISFFSATDSIFSLFFSKALALSPTTVHRLERKQEKECGNETVRSLWVFQFFRREKGMTCATVLDNCNSI
jgi:hypothetical protein